MQSKGLNLLLLIMVALSTSTYSFADEPVSGTQQETEEDLASRINRLNNREVTHRNGKATFQILRLGIKSGKLRFNGWRPPPSDWHEDYVVDAGPDGDVRLALVRKEIEIIRRFYSGNFQWVSDNPDKSVTLSALPKDDPSLEAFLMKENFSE